MKRVDKPGSFFIRILIYGLLLCTAGVSFAQTLGKKQPMTVEADRAELNERTGVSVYTGNVVVTQGGMTMKAERMSLHTTDRKLTRIVGTGKPASFKQQASRNATPISGKAQKFIYLPKKNQLTLIGNASLLKDDNTFNSERIVYNTANEYVSAGSKAGGKRVKIVIQPEEESEDSQP